MSVILDQTKVFLRAAENLNFDISSNGERRVLECIATINPTVVFDVGANAGEWSALARQYFPSSIVHAFEIVPTTYTQLVESTSSDRSVVANNVGLSNQIGTVTIHTSSQSSSVATANKIEGMKYHDEFYDSEVICETTTGKCYLDKKSIEKIDFLKVDVEGMDLRVLEGFGDRIRHVRVIQFEYGIFNISSRALLIDFFSLLKPHGFIIGKVYPGFVDFFEYHFSREDFGGHNYIAVKDTETDLIGRLAAK